MKKRFCKRYELLQRPFNMIYRFSQVDKPFTRKAKPETPPPHKKKQIRTKVEAQAF